MGSGAAFRDIRGNTASETGDPIAFIDLIALLQREYLKKTSSDSHPVMMHFGRDTALVRGVSHVVSIHKFRVQSNPPKANFLQ